VTEPSSESGTIGAPDLAETEGRERRSRLRLLARGVVRGLGLRPLFDRITGFEDVQWGRVVQRREITSRLEALDPSSLDMLEISGEHWATSLPWRSARSAHYPAFDICDEPLDERFDVIVADQVFEHLARPYRAAGNVRAMLRPGGLFVISTPLLVRVHRYPIDGSRWTDEGLRNFLIEAGFDESSIETGAWGNRACVTANFGRWAAYRPRIHSLRNEPDFPVHVWALGRTPSESDPS